jgi:hypothetical protein
VIDPKLGYRFHAEAEALVGAQCALEDCPSEGVIGILSTDGLVALCEHHSIQARQSWRQTHPHGAEVMLYSDGRRMLP